MTRSRPRTVPVGIGALALVLGLLGQGEGRAAAQDAGSPADLAASVRWEPLPVGWPTPDPITATAYVVMDAHTGQVVAEREADRPLPVASTVKVLTVLTALDHVDDGTVVTAGEEVRVGGAGVGLDPGEQWRIDDVLEAVMVRSGNDAARALAAHVGGTIPAFVEMMRAKADELGLVGAVIEDPTGLDDSNRLSARHLAVVSRAAMANDLFRAVAGARGAELPDLGMVATRNLLLDRYGEATGIKTGYTDIAGWCLIGSAERDGRELIAVVLASRSDEDRFIDAQTLLEFGFDDHTAANAPAALRLRRAGSWVEHAFGIDHVWLPPGEDGDVVTRVPAAADEPTEVLARWGGAAIGSWTALVLPDAPTGDASIGTALADAMYRAMRTGHRRGLWTAVESAGG